MPEQSTTSGLVESVHVIFAAAARRDWDSILRFYAPDAVLHAKDLGQTFEGAEAIRAFWAAFVEPYDDFAFTLEEVRYLGNGVVLAVFTMGGHLGGSSSGLSSRHAYVYEWAAGMVTRATAFFDIDEARAAAQRLAESRG